LNKTEYRQLVCKRVRNAVSSEHRSAAIILCDQFTSITEAEGQPRWTALPDALERAYEATTGHRPAGEMTAAELVEASSVYDYPAAYGELETALEQIFSSPMPDEA
jgi:hypothetical protein